MIHSYRISRAIYANDMSGAGAKNVGGRWNFKGLALIYTSATASLCTLECLAHFPAAYAPKDMA